MKPCKFLNKGKTSQRGYRYTIKDLLWQREVFLLFRSYFFLHNEAVFAPGLVFAVAYLYDGIYFHHFFSAAYKLGIFCLSAAFGAVGMLFYGPVGERYKVGCYFKGISQKVQVKS